MTRLTERDAELLVKLSFDESLKGPVYRLVPAAEESAAGADDPQRDEERRSE